MPLKDKNKKQYQVYVSENAWRAFPPYRRWKLLSELPADLKVAQPEPKMRTRRCIILDLETAAKLEVISTLNHIRNPWSPNSTGNAFGNGKIGLAIEAIGQIIAKKGSVN